MGENGEQNEIPLRPARTFHNPLIAEAAALAKERQLLGGAEEGPSPAKSKVSKGEEYDGGNAVKKGKSRWMDDDDEEEEDNSPAAAGAEAGTNKRRRSPIVWEDQSKAARTSHENGAVRALPSRPMTMAERAQAEVEEFRKRQAELAAAEEKEEAALATAASKDGDKGKYLGHSPDISSPEEEMHIRREGNSAHNLTEEQEEVKREEPQEVKPSDSIKPSYSLPAKQHQKAGLWDLDDLEDEIVEDKKDATDQNVNYLIAEATEQRIEPKKCSDGSHMAQRGEEEFYLDSRKDKRIKHDIQSKQEVGDHVTEQYMIEKEGVLPPKAGPERPPALSEDEDGFVADGRNGYPEVEEYKPNNNSNSNSDDGGYPEADNMISDDGRENQERAAPSAATIDALKNNELNTRRSKGKEEKGGVVQVNKRQVSMLNECRSVEHYEKLNRISEGTYGVVYRARDRETGQICALKKVKLEKERDGFPLTSVREINVLLSLAHPSIVNVSEVVVGSSLDAVFMVMEYADHDLKTVMEKRMHQPFTISEVKCLMHQLLSGISYLHGNWVIHRDLKTSNILYTNKGQLKICDFGLARQYGEPLKPYTQLVVTLWYRSPELLLGAKTYSTAVDVWSCGCIMAELLAKEPLFKGSNELSQLDTIFRILGCPTSETWPGIEKLENFKKFNFKGSRSVRSALRGHFPAPGPVFDGRPTLSESGFDLLQGLLELCPEKRMSAQQALDHPWFREHPLPKDPAMMPTFPGTNESLHGHRH
ncbi:hypothetical protein Ndes2437B_g06807 [Nannochloris sp. 'desiccata']